MDAYDITVADVRKCIGAVTLIPLEHNVPLSTLLQHFEVNDVDQDEEIGVVLEWGGDRAKRLPGFEVQVTAGAKFDAERERHISVKKYGGMQQPPDRSFDVSRSRVHIGAGMLLPSDELTFKTSLDTDSPGLLDDLTRHERTYEETGELFVLNGDGSETKPPHKISFPVKLNTDVDGWELTTIFRVRLYRKIDENGVSRNATYWIRIIYHLSELTPYPGLAAIDFGNSGCSLAVKLRRPMAVDAIEMIHIDMHNRERDFHKRIPMLMSAVHLHDIAVPDNNSDPLFPACQWTCGDDALAKPDERGLVVSPKRYLGRSEDEPVTVYGRDVSCHLPVELLMASILKEAHFAIRYSLHSEVDRGQPTMTLTYPSTFSRSEILRLQHCYLAAVERLLPARCGCAGVARLPRMIDEASAAAFYFLYRDFFYSAGRVPAFQYIYPRGANVLIMDFGGGTTDVALVHCAATSLPSVGSSGTPKGVEHKVRMKVLRRTGLRHFGGDIITSAVFKVLKAAIADHLSPGVLAKRGKDEKFAAWYAREAANIDVIVPTIFRRLAAGPNRDRRRQLAKDLWDWSERVKRWLGTPNEPFAEPVGSSSSPLDVMLRTGGPNQRRRRGQLAALGGEEAPEDWLTTQLPKKLQAEKGDVDDQIQPHLTDLMNKVNKLLNAEFSEANSISGEAAELHRAYVVGQAAHFLLIREAIKGKLAIQLVNHKHRQHEPDWDSAADLDVRRLIFDKQESKYAVAKGAVLFAFVKTGLFEAEFEGDENLQDRLPFDVLYETLATTRDIYLADDDYNRMKEQWVSMPLLRIKETDGNRTITLLRRWPGDETPTGKSGDETPKGDPFFEFSIGQPIVGDLKIRYAEFDSYSGFVLKDFDGDGEEIRGKWIASPETVPPMQRGDL